LMSQSQRRKTQAEMEIRGKRKIDVFSVQLFAVKCPGRLKGHFLSCLDSDI